MTRATRLFATYNAHADRLLFDVLDRLEPSVIDEPAGSYFSSILGLLNHVLLAGLTWLVRFREGGIDVDTLRDPVLTFEHPGWGKPLFDNYPAVREHQVELDRVFIRLTTEWGAAGCQVPFSYVTSRGEHHTKLAGEVLLHVFNHATHHRGQISQILDERGVEHDYSNLVAVVDDIPGGL